MGQVKARTPNIDLLSHSRNEHIGKLHQGPINGKSNACRWLTQGSYSSSFMQVAALNEVERSREHDWLPPTYTFLTCCGHYSF